MMFNSDMLDVITEVTPGFTIPQSLIDSSMYKYIVDNNNPGHIPYIENPLSFVYQSLCDDLFVNIACKSVDVCKWIVRNLQDYIVDDKMLITLMLSDRLSRVILMADDKEMIEQLMLENMEEMTIDLYYAFMSVDQLRWLKLTDPRYLFVNKFSICRTIGRLDVMKLLFEWYPAKFDSLRNATLSISDFIYQNTYDERQIETFEWLVETFNLQFTDVQKYSDLGQYLRHDNSVGHWMIVNHLDKVIKNPRSEYKTWLFNFIIENYSAQTMQEYIRLQNTVHSNYSFPAYLTVYPNYSFPAYLTDKQVGIIKYLHTIIPEY